MATRGGVRTPLLLGVLYLIALTTVTIVAQLLTVLDGDNGARRPPPQLPSPPQPPSPPQAPRPPPAPAWSMMPLSTPSEPPLWIRVRANGKFLSASAATSRVRPTARSPATDATRFRRVPVRSSFDGRRAWALRSVSTRRMLALRTFSDSALPALALVNESDVEERDSFAVFELPSELHKYSTPLHSLRALGPAGSGRASGCLHYPLEQTPPGLHLELQSSCDANSAANNMSEATPNVSVPDAPAAPAAFVFDVGWAASSTVMVNLASRSAPPVRIALGVAVRTHEATPPLELPLIRVFVPSLMATVGSRYATGAYAFTLYLGYDADDPTYDDPVLLAGVAVALRRLLVRSPVSVVAVKYGGEDKGAPCWVWNKLFARACDEGSDYFYQLNDDIQLLTPGWAHRFVTALNSSTPPNVGIAGPLDLHNERLMTQSFAACTHLDIFGFYYPWRFRNWFSDDWASQIYGPERTFWLQDIEVDHSLTKGPRYTISYEHGKVVQPLVVSARKQLCSWLQNATHATNENSFDSIISNYSVCIRPPPPPLLPPPALPTQGQWRRHGLPRLKNATTPKLATARVLPRPRSNKTSRAATVHVNRKLAAQTKLKVRPNAAKGRGTAVPFAVVNHESSPMARREAVGGA